MKMTCRGAIRKSPSSVSWAYSLLNLCKCGEADSAVVIKAWNDESAKSDKITGLKSQAVKNCLDLPEKAREQILLSVSQFGYEGDLVSMCSVHSWLMCVVLFSLDLF
jgi:hypothetical protein